MESTPATVTIEQHAPHSVTISRTATGAVTIEVKCYDTRPILAENAARDVFDRMQLVYPPKTKEAPK